MTMCVLDATGATSGWGGGQDGGKEDQVETLQDPLRGMVVPSGAARERTRISGLSGTASVAGRCLAWARAGAVLCGRNAKEQTTG